MVGCREHKYTLCSPAIRLRTASKEMASGQYKGVGGSGQYKGAWGSGQVNTRVYGGVVKSKGVGEWSIQGCGRVVNIRVCRGDWSIH